MTTSPSSPEECVDDLPLDEIYRNLLVGRIEYLLAIRCRDAKLEGIDEMHQNALLALAVPYKLGNA